MALNSVNTNVGAMIALQNLQITNNELSQVQSRINTGKKVASAKDNGAVWAIAQGQRAEIGALNEDFTSIRDQIVTVVGNASFNGVNLLNGTETAGFKALANVAGSTITIDDENMSLSGSIVTLATTESIATSTTATAALAKVDASIANVSASLARLGTGAKSLGTHSTFVGKLQDTLEAGVGNLVDADLAKESARLQALQTKQQLGVQALSIANSSTSIRLGLFR